MCKIDYIILKMEINKIENKLFFYFDKYIYRYVYEKILIEGDIFLTVNNLKFISYILVPLSLIISTGVYFSYFGLDSLNDFGSGLGQIAFYLILFILALDPLNFIFHKFKIFRTILGNRRAFGISAFYFTLFHFVISIFYFQINSLNEFIQVVLSIQTFFFGTIGLIIVFLLYLTSNNLSVRFLKKYWKWLHRLIYLGVIAILIHIVLIGDDITNYILFFSILVILEVLKFKKFRINFPYTSN